MIHAIKLSMTNDVVWGYSGHWMAKTVPGSQAFSYENCTDLAGWNWSHRDTVPKHIRRRLKRKINRFCTRSVRVQSYLSRNSIR